MSWSVEDSKELYNVANWSGGYFDVNDLGHLTVLTGEAASRQELDLYMLAEELNESGMSFPILVRLLHVLRHRVDALCSAFSTVMNDYGFTGSYNAIYPIKVNQNFSVVSEILACGHGEVGLEVGSKPELMAALGVSANTRSVIVCNGYKDREYIRLALIGGQLGHEVYIVVEKLSELENVIEISCNMEVVPRLGMRVRMATVGSGKWQNSGGDKSKFGLAADKVLIVVERLKRAGLLSSLELLHCHLGSQLPNIRAIQQGVLECGRYFVELQRLGAKIRTIDMGGGLGVDYEGTRSRSFCSVNYGLAEYAKNIVRIIADVCAENNLPHPNIMTESGRAMTAHHAVLITNVIDHEKFAAVSEPSAELDNEPLMLQGLRRSLHDLGSCASPLEIYHDATYQLSEIQSLYVHGVLSLEYRAMGEELYYIICRRVREYLRPSVRNHRETIDELNEKLADKYFCNFSVFQSLPDVWAIDQVFPIAPLSKLETKPTQHGVIEDITCDSDGCIEHYVDGAGVESSLPLHNVAEGETYLLGMFLVGAYQEILGDLHNLFGDTNSVSIDMDAQGNPKISEKREGDSVDHVLRYVHFDPEVLLMNYREKIAGANLDIVQQKSYYADLESGLQGYTYLEE